MTAAEFEREMLRRLREQQARYPLGERQDTVKLIFQGMLGPGHLLGTPEQTAGRITREMNGLTADPQETLFEEISPAWGRLNLRRAKAAGFTPEIISRMMTRPHPEAVFTRADVARVCGRMPELARNGEPDPEVAAAVMNAEWLPSHSEAYRAAYHPAYRVISAEWASCLEALCAICARLSDTGRQLITIDGPCATGKTTLAERLAAALGAAVIHTDDFVIPHREKTPERLAVPGGNCDAERLAAEVTAPWKTGRSGRYRRYNFMADCMREAEELPGCRIMILEGSYCNLPAIRQSADIRLFLELPWEKRLRRLRQRESPESLQRFFDRWIPLEDAYFAALRLPDDGCIRIGDG